MGKVKKARKVSLIKSRVKGCIEYLKDMGGEGEKNYVLNFLIWFVQ